MDDNSFDPAPITLPTIDLCDGVVALQPHEPPIDVDSGSYQMSWNNEIVESSTIQADPRPHKHTLKVPSFKGPVAIVRVITEEIDGTVTYKRYLLPRATGAQVQIWLEQLKETSTSFPFEFEGANAAFSQILIKGDPLLIETDRELHGPIENHKNGRHFQYEHPGFKRPFRIAAWAIVDATGHVVFENNSSTGCRKRGYAVCLGQSVPKHPKAVCPCANKELTERQH